MPKAEDQNNLGRAAMEQMSTADLEELLLRDFYSVESEASGMGELYQAAQILVERKKHTDSGAGRSWDRFWERYLTLAGEEDHPAEDGRVPSSDAAQGRRHSPSKRRLNMALAAAALAALLLSVSTAAADGGVWSGILAWWTDEKMAAAVDQIVRAERDEITVPEEPGDYADIQEALEAYSLSLQAVPRWLPDGFAVDEVIVDERLDIGELVFLTSYVRDEDWIIFGMNVYLVLPDGTTNICTQFQKDEGDPVPYESGGVTHMLATNGGRPVAVWTSGPAECHISGDITQEELEHMIDSIYET